MKQLNLNNYHRLQKAAVVSILLFAVVATIIFAFSKAAGGGSITLSPNSGSYAINSEFSVSVYENSGSETVSTVDIKLVYDQSKLQFKNISTAGSPFSFCTESKGGGGQISIVCSRIGGAVSGNQFVAKITFKALVGSGSTNVSIRPDSRLLKNDENDTNIWNGDTTGGTYTLTTPSSTPPPTGGGTSPSPSPNSSTSTSSSNPTPNSFSSQTATPNSQSSSPQSFSEQSAPNPTPGAVSNQNGYRVNIVVIDQNKKPVEGAAVSLDSKSVKSGDNGVATLSGVQVGERQVKVDYKAKTYQQTIRVLALADINKPQVFTVEIERDGFNYLVAIIPPLMAVLIGGAILGRTWLQKRAFEMKHFSKTFITSEGSQQMPVSQSTSLPYSGINKPGTTVQPSSPPNIPKPSS